MENSPTQLALSSPHPGIASLPSSPCPLSTDEFWGSLRLHDSLTRLEMVRTAPAGALSAEVVERIVKDSELLLPLALNPELSREVADRLWESLVGHLSPSRAERNGEHQALFRSVLDLLAMRGFAMPASLLEKHLDDMERGPNRRGTVLFLLRLPSATVSESVLLRIWDLMHRDGEIRERLLLHPAGGAALWTRIAMDAYQDFESAKSANWHEARGAMRSLSMHPEAVKVPGVNRLLCYSRIEDVMGRALPYASEESFAKSWRRLVRMDPATGPEWAASVLRQAPPERLALLSRADLKPLLEDGDQEIRLAAMAALAQVGAEVSPPPRAKPRAR